MNQIDRSPVVVFCQRMSPSPSALKSPLPAIDHAVGTTGSSAALPSQLVPLINHIERSPVRAFCQSIRIGRPADGASWLAAIPDGDLGELMLNAPPSAALALRTPGGAPLRLIGPTAGSEREVAARSGPRMSSPWTQEKRTAA